MDTEMRPIFGPNREEAVEGGHSGTTSQLAREVASVSLDDVRRARSMHTTLQL
jgi:hypothetical protein